MSKSPRLVNWGLRIIVALILLQTLYFKFTGAEESLYIFEQTGLGDLGRYGSGIAELAAAILILIPRTAWAGALIALGAMSGALFFHLTSLGIEIQNDGGLLFALAIVVFVSSLITLWIHRRDLPLIGSRFA